MPPLTRNSWREFISAPYSECPNKKCLLRIPSYGVFFKIAGSNHYTRKCYVCQFSENFPLPAITKKIVYLDQFVISNLIKLLDETHPSHQKIQDDPFWTQLFIKLERASKAQAIICPDSFYHRDESVVGGIEFRLMKRMYEHFSCGKTFYPSAIVQRFQMQNHFENWIHNRKTEFEYNPQHITFNQDLHTWEIGMQISIGGGVRDGEIAQIRESNSRSAQSLREVWGRWQTEAMSFEDRVKEETRAFGVATANTIQVFERRRSEAVRVLANDPNADFDINDILPPMSVDLMQHLTRIASVNGLTGDDVPRAIGRYFSDVDSLLEIPSLRISSVLFANLAHRAFSGEKNAPKSTADAQFISSYLPYCDALFVDKQCGALLGQFPSSTPQYLRLKEFNNQVFTLQNKEAFLEYLDQLVEQLPSDQMKVLKDCCGEDYDTPYWEIIQNERREMENEENE
jgi:hypothetical protein